MSRHKVPRKDILGVMPTRRPKRSDLIASRIRELISQEGLRPGDRLPQQWLFDQEMKGSKGTVREAIKSLETQGLVKTRTGPGGGAFVTALSAEEAMKLLSNLFLFNQPTIVEIYAIRKLLEPELAANLAGRLDEEAFSDLKETIRLYENEPATAQEEFEQRIAELDFHSVLAGFADNRLLGFICIFLHTLLRDLTVCRSIYGRSNPRLRETALHYQIRLMRSLKSGDAPMARKVMYEHMVEAERYMAQSAEIRRWGRSGGSDRRAGPRVSGT